MSVQLREVRLAAGRPGRDRRFPFDIPVIRSLGSVEFTTPVTFLVGENGSGKSTFLEALAVAAGAVAVGSAELRSLTRRSGRSATSPRRYRLTLDEANAPRFILRAEDCFGTPGG